MGLGKPYPFGMVLALVMSMGYSGGAERRITQFAVVVLSGQDDPAGANKGCLQWGKSNTRLALITIALVSLNKGLQSDTT